MTKDTYWFPHDSNASTDPKIVALVSVYGMAGKGRYWTLIEMLRDQSGYKYSIEKRFSMSSLADTLKFTLDECHKFIDDLVNHFELIKRDENFIWSDALSRRMEIWDEKKRVLSERGRKGAEKSNSKKPTQAKEVEAEATAQVDETPGTSESQAGDSSSNNSTVYNSIDNKERDDREFGKHTHLSPNKNSIKKPKDPASNTNHPEHDSWNIYNDLNKTISENYREVAKFKDQFSFSEYKKYFDDFPLPDGADILHRMLRKIDNNAGAAEKYRSVYHTVIKWIETEFQDYKVSSASFEANRRKASNDCYAAN